MIIECRWLVFIAVDSIRSLRCTRFDGIDCNGNCATQTNFEQVPINRMVDCIRDLLEMGFHFVPAISCSCQVIWVDSCNGSQVQRQGSGRERERELRHVPHKLSPTVDYYQSRNYCFQSHFGLVVCQSYLFAFICLQAASLRITKCVLCHRLFSTQTNTTAKQFLGTINSRWRNSSTIQLFTLSHPRPHQIDWCYAVTHSTCSIQLMKCQRPIMARPPIQLNRWATCTNRLCWQSKDNSNCTKLSQWKRAKQSIRLSWNDAFCLCFSHT